MKPVGAAHRERDWFWILCFAAAVVATLAAGALTIDLALNFFLHPIRFLRIGMASVFDVSLLQWEITFALLLRAAFLCLILVLLEAPRQKARDIVEKLGGTRVARNSPSLLERRFLELSGGAFAD